MKKILLIFILSLAALCGEAQVEDFDSVSYAIGDSYTRVYLSAETSNLNWEWNDTSAVDFLKAIDDHIHYLNYLQDSINSPSFSIGLMQGVFFLDSYEHYKEKDGILLECIIDGMSKVANNDLILPQDTIAIQEYMLSLPDDMNPSELPQEERCKFFSYYGTMKGLQPGLQDYIYEITGKSKDVIPANQKAYATGFLLMLIRMEAQENISSSYELGKIMITDVIFELIRYNSISSKFNLESFKLGCRAAMGLAERKLSISQCDEIATLSRGEDDADDVDDEPKVVTEVLDLNDDERLSLDCNKKLPKDCEVRVYSALSHEELATYINNNRELSKLYSSTGYFSASDTTKMNRLFKKIKLPKNVKTMWLKPWDSKDSFEPLCYYNTPLIKTNGVIESVEIDKNSAGLFSIILKLNDEKQWEQVTEQNIGKRLAFEINGHVLYAPTVHQTITGGRTAVHITKELLKSISLFSRFKKND